MSTVYWLVRMQKDDYEAASYGSPIQAIVSAEAPETARKLGADILGVPAERLHAEIYMTPTPPGVEV